jgi:hypothetical protein
MDASRGTIGAATGARISSLVGGDRRLANGRAVAVDSMPGLYLAAPQV